MKTITFIILSRVCVSSIRRVFEAPMLLDVAETSRGFRAMPDDAREEMGLRGRRLAEERYSWKRIVEGTLDWFAEVAP